MVEQRSAAQLLGAENKGTEVIVRDSDGAVFIRQDVAERGIDRLRAQLAELQRPADAELVRAVRNSFTERHGACGTAGDCERPIGLCCWDDEARAILAAVAPRIRAAERERIEENSREIISALECMKATPDRFDIEWHIAEMIREIAELPDRTSHEGKPDFMLVTAHEMTELLHNFAATIRAGADDGE